MLSTVLCLLTVDVWLLIFPSLRFLIHLLCVCSPSQVTEISMGEFLMHSSVVWLNPHPSLGRMRKEPEMTVFGESGHCSIVTVAYLSKLKAKISALSLSLSRCHLRLDAHRTS